MFTDAPFHRTYFLAHPLREQVEKRRRMSILVRDWDISVYGKISEAKVRVLHRPLEHFRISRSVYSAGEDDGGSMRACICYVLRGACSYSFGPEELIEIHESQFAHLPEGSYEFRVLGEQPIELILVWTPPKESQVVSGPSGSD